VPPPGPTRFHEAVVLRLQCREHLPRHPLHSWYDEAVKAVWSSPQDVKNQYANAIICGNNRVVFNIGGNTYRLVVEMQYRAGIARVKFVGTHAQYDRIEVEIVNEHQAHPE
jgi:mRNA interferase HigB